MDGKSGEGIRLHGEVGHDAGAGDPFQVGTLEPGKFADIVAVEGDPLKDITALEHVDFVMKNGAVAKKP